RVCLGQPDNRPVLDQTDTILENGKPTSSLRESIVSAEAYLGAEPIAAALRDGAQIVMTSRVADPSLFLAPLMHEFGWDPLDHAHLGPGSAVGHILECGAQVTGTGGAITTMTVKEQILYEVHDPANYVTPDVVVDSTTARIEEIATDRVRVSGVSGKPRTPTLKVSIGCAEGFIGEDMFFYAGPGALARAQLARRILEERFRIVGLKAEDIRIDFI